MIEGSISAFGAIVFEASAADNSALGRTMTFFTTRRVVGVPVVVDCGAPDGGRGGGEDMLTECL